MKIQILLYPGFDELDVIGPFEVLKMAQSYGASLDVELVTLNGTENEIVGQHGLSVKTKIGEKFDQENSDLILLPGGGWGARSARGAFAESKKGAIPRALEEFVRARCFFQLTAYCVEETQLPIIMLGMI